MRDWLAHRFSDTRRLDFRNWEGIGVQSLFIEQCKKLKMAKKCSCYLASGML